MKEHTKTGNCFLDFIWECGACGEGNYCDVCHAHHLPRGYCDDCEPCEACQEEELSDD